MKMNHKAIAKTVVLSGAIAALSACGGGGGGDSAPVTPSKGTAEGVYSGTLTGGSNSVFNLIVLEDGQYWSLVGNVSGGIFFVAGLVQGQGTSSNGKFTSSNLADFENTPATTGSITASYVAGTSISGTAVDGGVNVGLAGQAIPTATLDYNTPALLSSVTGAWSLGSTSGETLSVNVAADGSLTGQGTSGCAFTGSIAPRPSGKNVYNVRVQFANSTSCGLPGQTVNGIGVYSIPSAGQHQLIVAITDSTRSYGSAAVGSR